MTNQARRYNTIAVERLSVKHGFTKRFIRQCISGDRTSQTADTIKKDYKELVSKITESTK
ncbi:MAG: hypothetical protein HYR91_13410 [Flavobacteriia bacterium]|nr:hypothetical protein [Flavobacteriia bacterium]